MPGNLIWRHPVYEAAENPQYKEVGHQLVQIPRLHDNQHHQQRYAAEKDSQRGDLPLCQHGVLCMDVLQRELGVVLPIDQAALRIPADFPAIANQISAEKHYADTPENPAQPHAGEHGKSRDGLGQPHCKGVDGGRAISHGNAHQDDGRAHDGVISQPDGQRNQDREEGQTLLRHPNHAAGQAKHDHQQHNDPLAPPGGGARPVDHLRNQAVKGLRRVDNAEGPADDEDKEHRNGVFQKSRRNRHEKLPDADRSLFHCVIGSRLHDLPSALRDAVKGSGGDQIRQYQSKEH